MYDKKTREKFIRNIPNLSLISDDVSPDSFEDILKILKMTKEFDQEDLPPESDDNIKLKKTNCLE